ncbi:MAG: RNA polymerase sigma factor [Deltaproteobacteria bacterium]
MLTSDRWHGSEETHFSARVRNCAIGLQRKGETALAELFDLVAPRSVRYARALTHNQDDAEDALQAAFVRVALYPRALAEADRPWAYLLRIVRNEALKMIQKKRGDEHQSQAAEAWIEDASIDFDARQLVQQSLEKLPSSQSEVVLLKIWEGMTFAEIAEVLGESPNTAASRYRYALQKLAQYLQPLAEEARYV